MTDQTESTEARNELTETLRGLRARLARPEWSGDRWMPMPVDSVRILVESILESGEMILELETRLAAVTAERDKLRAALVRIHGAAVDASQTADTEPDEHPRTVVRSQCIVEQRFPDFDGQWETWHCPKPAVVELIMAPTHPMHPDEADEAEFWYCGEHLKWVEQEIDNGQWTLFARHDLD